MMAVRAARAHTGRDPVVRLDGAYHGTYDQVVGAGEPGVPEAVRALTLEVPQDDEPALVQAFRAHGERIAAVLVDLMPSRAGLRPLSPSFVAAVQREAAASGALVIVDEVITFRLGVAGLQSAYGLAPDLTVLAKIIGGGFPVGAAGGRADFMACFDPGRSEPIHWGGTFSGQSLALVREQRCVGCHDHDDRARAGRATARCRRRDFGDGDLPADRHPVHPKPSPAAVVGLDQDADRARRAGVVDHARRRPDPSPRPRR